jgi:hypothetical protein
MPDDMLAISRLAVACPQTAGALQRSPDMLPGTSPNGRHRRVSNHAERGICCHGSPQIKWLSYKSGAFDHVCVARSPALTHPMTGLSVPRGRREIYSLYPGDYSPFVFNLKIKKGRSLAMTGP